MVVTGGMTWSSRQYYTNFIHSTWPDNKKHKQTQQLEPGKPEHKNKTLNFIEFFWGAVKRYLYENGDYSFTTLQENMLNALVSVSVETIQKCEHRMKQ